VPAPKLEKHTQRWQDDGDQDVHAVGRPLRHGCLPSRSALLASVKLDRWTDAVLRPMILPVVLLLLGLDSWMDRILPDFLLPLALVPALAGGRASLYRQNGPGGRQRRIHLYHHQWNTQQQARGHVPCIDGAAYDTTSPATDGKPWAAGAADAQGRGYR
jgi:hypothetical protein